MINKVILTQGFVAGDILLLFAAGLSVLMAVQQLTSATPKAREYVLAAMFFCVGLLFTELSLVHAGFAAGRPWTTFLLCTAFSLLGPLTWVYTNIVLHGYEMEGWFRKHRKHFIVPAALFVAELSYYLVCQSLGVLTSVHAEFLTARSGHYLHYFYLFAFSVVAFYTGLRFVMFVRNRNQPKIGRKLKFLSILSFFTLLACAAFYFGFMYRVEWLFTAGQYVGLGSIVIIFVSVGPLPNIYGTTTTEEKKEKYQKSLLTRVDLGAVTGSLEHLMTDEKLYRKSDLSLEDIAGRLSMNRYQLSEFLNQHLKTGFRQYINGYRIDEAKAMLLENPNQDVLSICYSVGFHSKSSFNDAFKKITGYSPRDFRNLSLKKV